MSWNLTDPKATELSGGIASVGFHPDATILQAEAKTNSSGNDALGFQFGTPTGPIWETFNLPVEGSKGFGIQRALIARLVTAVKMPANIIATLDAPKLKAMAPGFVGKACPIYVEGEGKFNDKGQEFMNVLPVVPDEVNAARTVPGWTPRNPKGTGAAPAAQTQAQPANGAASGDGSWGDVVPATPQGGEVQGW